MFASSGGPYDVKKPIALTSVALTPEHYNRIARLMEHKIPVKLQFNIQNQFFDDQTDSVNVIAEIPGQREEGRDRHAGRASGFLARRHRRHR